MPAHRFFLLKGLMALGIAAVFGRIYQQNCIIKLQYEKQRLERHYQQIQRKRNAVLVSLSEAKNYTALKERADLRGMRRLQLSKLITFTGDFA